MDGGVHLDLGAPHLHGVVVALLVLDLHQRECRLVVDGLVQANVDHKCRNSIVSVIESEINPS